MVKSGKPCERFMAPSSSAIFDITENIEVPTSGKRDVIFIAIKTK
jgi:hypothetical protein